MYRSLAAGILIIACIFGSAHAQTCSPYSYTLTNGTTADANQVMANFTTILGCANSSLAPVANPSFTGNVAVNGGSQTITDGASGSSNAFINLVTTDFGATVPYLFMKPAAGGAWDIGLWNGSALYGTLDFQAPTISLGGNVGIGTSTPSQLLHVYSSTSGAVAEYQNSAGACTLTPGASSLTISCSSDIRLKTDVTTASDALAFFDDMPIRDFTVRSTGLRKTGVIAQEIIKTHPDMVHRGPDDLYTVDQPDPWKLVKAIQELKSETDALRRTNELQAVELRALRSRLERADSGRVIGAGGYPAHRRTAGPRRT